MDDYKGKWVLVTGAGKTGRVGAAIARYFAEHGANIYLHYRSKPNEAQAVADEIHAATGVEVALLQADLTKPEGVERIFAGIKPDVVINNAATFNRMAGGLDLAQKATAFDEAVGANSKSTYLVAEAAITAWQSAKMQGVLVFVGDAFIERGAVYGSGLEAYTVSKAGIAALVAQYGAIHGKQGIRVIGVMNGPIEPPPKASQKTIEATREEINLPPEELNDWIGPIAVAEAVYHLTKIKVLNGEVVTLDGARVWFAHDEHDA